jgi:hypothetical protein
MPVLGISPEPTRAAARGLLNHSHGGRGHKPGPLHKVEKWKLYSHSHLALAIKKEWFQFEEIKELQRQLTALGFYDGEIDGLFNPATQRAHEAYRKSFLQYVSFGPISAFAQAMVEIAEAEAKAGVKEEGGNNRGPKVEEYEKYVGSAVVGQSWCAAFVCWCMGQVSNKIDCSFTLPKEASAFRLEDWAVAQRSKGVYLLDPEANTPRRGDIVIFNFSHVGFCRVDESKGSFGTVEGNTTAGVSKPAAERDGGGVYERSRKLKLVRSLVRLGAGSVAPDFGMRTYIV